MPTTGYSRPVPSDSISGRVPDYGGGRVGFVLVRARAHRLLLAAALLTVLLTTAVLTTLTAYSGAIGDAALQHSLNDPRNAPDTALIVKADVPAAERTAAESAVRKAAERTFDQLPVTVRTLERSGPYALPRSLQPPAARSGDPDLTFFGALDRTQVRLVSGRFPRATASGDIEVALPRTAAEGLGVKAGTRLALADRLGGSAAHIVVTGVYRPAVAGGAYWLLDDLRGRGLSTAGFTTYGPLLADPSALTGGRLSAGASAWLASADFSTLTTGRIGALRESAGAGSDALRTGHAVRGSHGRDDLAARRTRPAGPLVARLPLHAADRRAPALAARGLRAAAGGPAAEHRTGGRARAGC